MARIYECYVMLVDEFEWVCTVKGDAGEIITAMQVLFPNAVGYSVQPEEVHKTEIERVTL